MTDNEARSIKDTQLEIRRVYVKDLSFESPQAPRAFAGGEKNPTIDVQMGVQTEALEGHDGYHEVVLTITVTANTGNGVLFLNEVQQAGVFEARGFSDDELNLVLNVACPNILLPFARAVITDMVSRGGFPQLLINPINFEVLYAQKLKRDKEAAEGEGGGGPTTDAAVN